MSEGQRQELVQRHNHLVTSNRFRTAHPGSSTNGAAINEEAPSSMPPHTSRPARTPQRSTGGKKPHVPGDPITPQGTLFCLKCKAEHPHEHFRQEGRIGYRCKAQGDLTYQKWCEICLKKYSRQH